jgi:hypothetical protein
MPDIQKHPVKKKEVFFLRFFKQTKTTITPTRFTPAPNESAHQTNRASRTVLHSHPDRANFKKR